MTITARLSGLPAPAKLNLFLHVVGRRDDGYHLLQSAFMLIDWQDTLDLTCTQDGRITRTEEEVGGLPANDLCVRAAQALQQATGCRYGAQIHLRKQIPVQAGMGGGSSDAAAVLRGLNRMTGQQLSLMALADMGAKLGADVPFCVAGGCRRCEGIGEKLTPLAGWAGLPVVIVRPGVSISTGKAYGLLDVCPRRRAGTAESCIEALKNKDRAALLASLSNDFEDVLFKAEPVLGETFSYLSSLCKKTMMTGSGSAFFLMVENEVQQRKLAAKIKEERPQWYVGTAETIL